MSMHSRADILDYPFFWKEATWTSLWTFQIQRCWTWTDGDLSTINNLNAWALHGIKSRVASSLLEWTSGIWLFQDTHSIESTVTLNSWCWNPPDLLFPLYVCLCNIYSSSLTLAQMLSNLQINHLYCTLCPLPNVVWVCLVLTRCSSLLYVDFQIVPYPLQDSLEHLHP